MPITRIRIENLKEVQANLRRTAVEEVPFVTAAALTATAKAGQAKIQREILPAHFTLRHASWIKNNIRVDPATKTNLVAAVRDTYGAMEIQETGGTKIPYGRAIAVPLRGARPSPSSLIAPENMPAAVMARGGFINGSIMYDVTVKAGRRGSLRGAKGISRAASWSRQIVPMYVLVPRASIRARYGFVPALLGVVQSEFGRKFAEAFKKYVKGAV